MPHYPVTYFFAMHGASIGGTPPTLTYNSGPNEAIGHYSVFDIDDSGTMTAGDYFAAASNGYSGYTIDIGGVPYALFYNSAGGGAVYIPHGGELSLASIPASGASVTENPDATVANCFAEGTLIATPDGEVAIETLAAGDSVLSADGRVLDVKWLGRQTILKVFARERAQLVRIAAGALGNHSDLLVTADHGMMLEGHIVNAAVLVNGTTIDYVPLSETPERQRVYHVETGAHEAILANGAAAETYLTQPGRQAFDNFRAYLMQYGEEREIAENPMPRITSARLLPESLKGRLSA